MVVVKTKNPKYVQFGGYNGKDDSNDYDDGTHLVVVNDWQGGCNSNGLQQSMNSNEESNTGGGKDNMRMMENFGFQKFLETKY